LTSRISTKIIEFSTLPTNCSYLKNHFSRMQYKYIENCSSDLNNKLVQRGWRRFGNYYSRPQCENCNKCESLRIDAQNFTFSRNAKRTIKKNKNTVFSIQTPTMTNEHLEIYEKYHNYMQTKKGWKILYYIDDKLVGVDLVDFLDDGISSIYFFYDPDFKDFSLGRYSIYMQIQLAKNFNLKWIYLGYYVKDCPSLNYKDRYKPYDIMQNNATLEEMPIWKSKKE